MYDNVSSGDHECLTNFSTSSFDVVIISIARCGYNVDCSSTKILNVSSLSFSINWSVLFECSITLSQWKSIARML